MRSIKTILCLMLLSLTGCQCCSLTEHYACAVDGISDHEHAYERFYSPGWDLNRIGRSDWCSYRKNRLLCGCVCDRCKPAPCEFAVCTESILPAEEVSQPDWSQPAADFEVPAPNGELDAFEGLAPPAPSFPEDSEE